LYSGRRLGGSGQVIRIPGEAHERAGRNCGIGRIFHMKKAWNRIMMTIETKELMEILSNVLKVEGKLLENMNEHTDLRNFNLGSITAMELIVAIEERYDILVSEDDLSIENVNTVHKIRQLILKYKSAA
jgi:methoxymalonate biosynthesis acyl carrier protein